MQLNTLGQENHKFNPENTVWRKEETVLYPWILGRGSQEREIQSTEMKGKLGAAEGFRNKQQ